MAWISYAQNAEDVRLRRAFRGQTSGFYIDVGANNPVTFSVTKHFYERGWTGINVEPIQALHELIRHDRPRDINLNVGCSDGPGTLTLHVARGVASGMSTFTEEERRIHEAKGFEFDTVTTPVVTLASICEQHLLGRTIDFLSIDVEGHEREVLKGADFARFRPRVIVIEATRPNSTEPTHDRWEDLILSQGYIFAVFDGLNRYYVRREDEALIPDLALSPNVFDDYTPYTHHREIEELKARLLAHRAAAALTEPFTELARAARKLSRWFTERSRG
jgi:FkbM family methyltransferase